jgi:uncharacterized membrane protein YfhO
MMVLIEKIRTHFGVSSASPEEAGESVQDQSALRDKPGIRRAGVLKKRLLPYMPFMLAFFLPVVILIGIYIGKGIYPFGDSTFLKLDMYHQYAPFLRSFARKLRSGESLTYAWDIGLGTNYVPLYAYYLASPFYWISGLVPDSLILDFMSYLTVLKIGLCGLSMSIYLSLKYRTRSYTITVFALCYALCGYIAAYSWCLMWLDVLVFTPLILYGLECLVKDGRPFLYCVTLGAAIFTNYYIAIMLCIFLVLYFICLLIMNPPKGFKKFLGRCGLFALFSLLGGGLAAAVLVPCVYGLGYTASANSTFPKTWTNYFSVIEMLMRHLAVVETEQGLDHWPNIYCGVLVFLCLPFYYMNRHVSWKDKAVKASLLAVMLLSYSLNIPNYIWHGMHYPNSLPARQSYLYIILLLTMCFEGFRYVRELSKRQVVGTMWGVFLLIMVMEKLNTNEDIHFSVWYVSMGFLALYSLFIYLDVTKKIFHSSMVILLIGTLVIETGLNTAVTSVNTVGRNDYWNSTEEYSQLVSMINDSWPFYRVEKFTRRTKNDAAWIGYHSTSVFSSTAHAGISEFFKSFGFEGNTNAYCFTGATPLAAAMLSVKYQLSNEEQQDSLLRRKLGSIDKYSLYQNTYTLPLGFMLPEDIDEAWTLTKSSPADSQNSFSQAVSGLNVLKEIEGIAAGSTFTFTPPVRQPIFVHIDTSTVTKVTATYNGKTKTFNDVNRGYLIDLGYCDIDTEISIKAEGDAKTIAASAYYFDEDAFIRTWEALNDEALALTEFTDNRRHTAFSGTVTAQEDGYLFLSIPFENGWSVLVDGRPSSTHKLADAFLGVHLTQGSHSVRLEYRPEGLSEGRALSIISAAIVVLLYFLTRKEAYFRGLLPALFPEAAPEGLKK